jgi:CheY-like chemotaxis protein
MTEQLKRWNDELERRVEERTAELEQSQHRLRSMAMELNLAEQRERKRIASELHDYLAQLLVLGRLKLGQAKQLVLQQQSRELLVQVEDVLKESLAYTRNLVHDLSPPVLFEFGLIAALRWLGERMQQHDLTVAVDTALERLHLPEDLAVVLFQSVRELLMNVVKHAGTGRAEVRLESVGPALHLIVRDEGPGFDCGVRAATPASSGSNGFGLFSIRERMRAVGGTLQIESSPGHGTTVTLTIPLAPDSLPTLDPKLAPVGSVLPTGSVRERMADGPGGLMRVLLVDDNAMVRQGLRSLIDGFTGMEVIAEAGDGEEAVALADGLKPSVIVMDIHMPKMNGIEATRQITSRHPEMVVIGLSVDAGLDNRAAMMKSGAAALLSKEAAVSQLEGAIKRAIAERGALCDVGLPPTLPSPGPSQH